MRSCSAKDDLYEANLEYTRLHPWIKVSLAGAIIGMIGWLVSLVYLTLLGRREDSEEISLSFVDRIKTEILIAVFVLIASELFYVVAKVKPEVGCVGTSRRIGKRQLFD